MKQDLKSMTLAEMQEAFVALGEPKFRAKQVFTCRYIPTAATH